MDDVHGMLSDWFEEHARDDGEGNQVVGWQAVEELIRRLSHPPAGTSCSGCTAAALEEGWRAALVYVHDCEEEVQRA